jgi:hypothetical protein
MPAILFYPKLLLKSADPIKRRSQAPPGNEGKRGEVATYKGVRIDPPLAPPKKEGTFSKPPFLRGVWGDLDAQTYKQQLGLFYFIVVQARRLSIKA